MSTKCFVSGMSVNTPLGDNLDEFLNALYLEKSAIASWHFFKAENNYSKIGGDLSTYNIEKKCNELLPLFSKEFSERAQQIIKRSPWSAKISTLMLLDAWRDAGLTEREDEDETGIIVCGSNLNMNYYSSNFLQYQKEPDFIDPLLSLACLDTNHSCTLSEVVQAKAFAYSVGGACISGALGILSAMYDIQSGRAKRVFVVAPIFDYSPLYLHSLAMMGALSINSFLENPTRASRPFDLNREGFVPTHGGGVLLIESEESIRERKGKTYAEILGVETNSGANRLAKSSVPSQVKCLDKLFKRVEVMPNDISFVSAHAASTQQGDLAEIQTLETFFKDHAKKLKINAVKSLLGHTTTASGIVELVAAILQMNRGLIHRTVNVDQLDPEIKLDVCQYENQKVVADYLLKDSFGFGGLSSFVLLKNLGG